MLRLALAILLAPFFWGLLGLAGEQLIFLVFPEAADGSATPLGVQISYWDALPVWYHPTFLTLLIPFAILGSWACGRRGRNQRSLRLARFVANDAIRCLSDVGNLGGCTRC